jgi:hypothetical protein
MKRPGVVKAAEPGVWGVANSQVEGLGSNRRSDPSGLPDLRARLLAAGALLCELRSATPLDVGHELITLCEHSERLSVMIQDPTGTVRVLEGTGVPAGPEPLGIVLLARNTRSTLYRLDMAGQVLAVRRGLGGAQALSDEFHDALSEVPATSVATTEEIGPAGATAAPIRGSYLVQGPAVGPATAAAGCLFLAIEAGAAAELWGYFWAPEDSGLVSEMGIMSALELANSGGRVQPRHDGLTLDAVLSGLLGTTRREAYQHFR